MATSGRNTRISVKETPSLNLPPLHRTHSGGTQSWTSTSPSKTAGRYMKVKGIPSLNLPPIDRTGGAQSGTSASPSVIPSNRAVRQGIHSAEPCFVSMRYGYCLENAHLVKAIRKDKGLKEAMESFLEQCDIVRPPFNLNSAPNLVPLEHTLHCALDMGLFAITCSKATLLAMQDVVRDENRVYDERRGRYTRNFQLDKPPFSNAEYEMVMLHPEHFLPVGNGIVMHTKDPSNKDPSNKPRTIPKLYMIAKDGVLREGKDSTSPRFPAFPFTHPRAPERRMNPLLLILNAEVAFQHFLRLPQEDHLNRLYREYQELIELTLELVVLLFHSPISGKASGDGTNREKRITPERRGGHASGKRKAVKYSRLGKEIKDPGPNTSHEEAIDFWRYLMSGRDGPLNQKDEENLYSAGLHPVGADSVADGDEDSDEDGQGDPVVQADLLVQELKKDPGIPKLPDIRVRVRQSNRIKTEIPVDKKLDQDATMASEPTSTLAQLAADADAASSSHTFQQENHIEDPSSSSGSTRTKEQIRRYYLKALHKVIDQSDIIILVLDARDPEGCRSRLVEEEVRRREAEGKKLVFVLNKIDLIPKANAQAWLKYLRHSTPTLPFLNNASSQQRNNISSSTAPALMKLLKAYKPSAGSVTVGVVGYPNVGKSSLINSLKRSKVCAVAAAAGHTKDLQSIQLERGMRVIDSPGVVFDDDDYDDGKGSKKGSVLLRNVVKVEDVEDPTAVVEEIMIRTPSETLQKIYNLPEYGSTLEFLTMLALSSGRLLKGGTPDLTAAARHVLADWNAQKIPYHSEPPTVHPSLIPSTMPTNPSGAVEPIIRPGAEQVGQAQILTTLSKPFELGGLFNAADAGAFGAKDVQMEAEAIGEELGLGMEGMALDEDVSREENKMEDEELIPRLSVKRSRSPDSDSDFEGPSARMGVTSAPAASANRFAALTATEAPSSAVPSTIVEDKEPSYAHRQPKRQRRNKDVPEYDAQPDANVLKRMERSNPLSRRNLKGERKKERRAAKLVARKMREEMGEGGMEGVEELEFTFMA
ncbi:hypothetical protein DFP72DRAFT_1164431 [Ephemerocybe angulata]|uniref:CP-type G domain-containing protein n=1 Tax=Ephemerocybe angulata TaxID=980116 RepID=A0A8H6ME55_9AGAR|nr:hypothetical protein DFP72DRAFT_1164431 [Tulosesus angulatus]